LAGVAFGGCGAARLAAGNGPLLPVEEERVVRLRMATGSHLSCAILPNYLSWMADLWLSPG
jgi:hypothetical protein